MQNYYRKKKWSSQTDSAIERAVHKLGYASLKKEQLKVVVGITEGRDVFAVLPNRYGKSLCSACLPRPVVLDQLQVNGGTEESPQALVVVVTPLTAIAEDQVYRYGNSVHYVIVT